MKRTEVFATDEMLKEIASLVETARKTPVITFNVGEPDMASVAWKRVHEKIHEWALALGLPEIPGYYGIDQGNGEFLVST